VASLGPVFVLCALVCLIAFVLCLFLPNRELRGGGMRRAGRP